MIQALDAAQFGIGWRHPHYAPLLENPLTYSGTAPGAVDFLEVHSENFFGAGGAARSVLMQARQTWPISLHGVGLGLGSATGIDAWHLDQLCDLVQRIDPLLVSDHACFARGVLPQLGPVHASDLLPIPFSHAALAVLCSNVSQVQDRLQRPIAVENLSAYFSWRDADFSEVEFLNTLCQRTQCRLLVDVNNIYVNALNHQHASTGRRDDRQALQSCQVWLDGIQAHVVAEIHVAGHNAMQDMVIDDHSCPVNAPVWQLYQHAKRRFPAANSLVEWDTDVPALEVLLGELQRAKHFALASTA